MEESRFLPLASRSMGSPGWSGDSGVNYLTTAAWQAIASPTNRVALPSLSSLFAESVDSPDGMGRTFEPGRSLWNIVLQMSLTSLGWPSPALGFLRWREMGYPIDDPRFALFAHLLGDDLDLHTGHLLVFLFSPGSGGRTSHCWTPRFDNVPSK